MSRNIQRGWALTTILLAAMVIPLVGVVIYVRMLTGDLPSVLPPTIVAILLCVCILRVVAAIAIWLWIREGVILYGLLTLFAIPVMYSQGFKSSPASLLGVALLVFLVWNKWPFMRWLLLPANQRLERP